MDDRNSSRQMIGTLVFLIAGPILWAIDLMLIYGAQSSLCAFGALPLPGVSIIVGGTSVGLALMAGGIWLWPEPSFRTLAGTSPPTDQWPFLRGTMRLLAALSALAMLYFAAAALLLPACGGLR
ncbi:hypothetical protein [Devosia sp. CAU 1758]